MDIKSWDWDTIVCNLDRTGPRANGDVIVQVQGANGAWRKSNVHQLTEWNIPLHYFWPAVLDIAGLKIEGTGKLRFRADVGSYREKPHEPPVFPYRGMVPTKDSSAAADRLRLRHRSATAPRTLAGGTVVFPVETARGHAVRASSSPPPRRWTRTRPTSARSGSPSASLAGGSPFKIELSGGPRVQPAPSPSR